MRAITSSWGMLARIRHVDFKSTYDVERRLEGQHSVMSWSQAESLT